MRNGEHVIEWVDSGHWPQHPPDPNYPNGMTLDLSSGASLACSVDLPYPAKRIGHYIISCRTCGLSVVVSTAGRADDPRAIKLACKRQ